jgi:hypothetical protein
MARSKGFKCTLFFNSGVQGWTESWTNCAVANLDDMETDSRALAMKRLAICGLGVELVGIRISNQDAVPPVSRPIPIQANGLENSPVAADASVTGYSDPVTRAADVSYSDLLLMCRTAAGRKKLVWLAGMPDALIRTDPNGIDLTPAANNATWLANYQLWRALVQGGKWGFVGRDKASTDVLPQAIVQWVAPGGAGSNIAFVLNGGSIYSPGDQVAVTGTRAVNKANRVPNGKWIVQQVQSINSGTQTQYTLNASAAIDVTVIFKPGTVAKVAYDKFVITAVQVLRQGEHKRGRPFGGARGRRTIAARV